MQQQTPTDSKPLTIRGADGKPHLLSDMKPQKKPVSQTRIRPIVPTIFRLPD
jgi:hypothetical protein